MNLRLIPQFLVALTVLASLPALAGQTQRSAPAKRINTDDIDSLGGNRPLMDMAQALDPENRARIVQRRTVDRYNRLELGIAYGGIAGGDPYVRTQSLGVNADFHITPHWALGLRYNDYGNSLTPEGQRMYDEYRSDRAAGNLGSFVDTDSPQRSGVAILEWYPIYGKINMFDSGIAQFDFYLLGGGGQMQLEKEGGVALMTAGAGIGFWVNNHFTIRGEARWQNYHDQVMQSGGDTVSRNINGAIATLGVGFLL